MTIISNRIPYEYFVTKGKGESDAGSKFLPYETGSYDEALNQAGIQNVNIMEYTSVMPKEAKEISKHEGINRLKWGSVLECIKAQANGKKGSKISAAVMVTTVHDPNGKYLGGLACEYSGTEEKKDIEKSLENSLNGMIERRGYGIVKNGLKMYRDNITDSGYKIHPGKIFEYETLNVKKKHGTVLACICFVSHKIPVISKNYKRTIKNNKKYLKKNRTQKNK